MLEIEAVNQRMPSVSREIAVVSQEIPPVFIKLFIKSSYSVLILAAGQKDKAASKI